MKNKIIVCFLLICFTSCKNSNKENETEWTELFNGNDLNDWHANTGRAGNESSLKAEEVFVVSNGVIHVYKGAKSESKQYNANLYHKDIFSKFHLQVVYRWLDNKFQPRAKANRDAGVLFHIHNDPTSVWPSSVEMQMGDGKPGQKYVTGDLWCIHTLADSPKKGKFYVTDGEHATIGNPEGKGYHNNLTSIHAEKPLGEWNTMDIYVDGSKSAKYYLNNTLVNEVYNMRFLDEDGKWKPLDKGHISVQGEWAELEYKTIRIKEL